MISSIAKIDNIFILLACRTIRVLAKDVSLFHFIHGVSWCLVIDLWYDIQACYFFLIKNESKLRDLCILIIGSSFWIRLIYWKVDNLWISFILPELAFMLVLPYSRFLCFCLELLWDWTRNFSFHWKFYLIITVRLAYFLIIFCEVLPMLASFNFEAN